MTITDEMFALTQEQTDCCRRKKPMMSQVTIPPPQYPAQGLCSSLFKSCDYPAATAITGLKITVA